MKSKFKKVISTCLAAVMLLSTAVIAPITASAAQTQAVSTGETSSDFEYELLDDGTAEITIYTGSATEVTIPSELDGKKVTSIGGAAFYGCTSLTSITIPDSVTSIGDDAFYNCTSLASITIPESVTEIGYAAFENTAWYDNQPDGVVYAGKVLYTYKGEMPENTTITVKDGTKSISDIAFSGCTSLASITIPNSVTSIGDYAFSDCRSLESITIPNSVTSIGNAAFAGCTSLASIHVDSKNESYTEIDGVLFDKEVKTLVCYPIGKNSSSYSIPDSVTSIGARAFENCTSLTSITIPDGVTSIGNSAFFRCTSLASITIPDSVTEICVRAFYDTAWYDNQPDGVVYAGKVLYIYKGEMPQNTNITVKDGTKSISDSAFSACRSLTSVTIPDSVTSIGGAAFYGCTSLTSITIPASVKCIGDFAFGYYPGEYNEIKIDGFKISGYSGTEAETYANDNGFEFISLGEVPTTEPTTEPATTEPATEPTTEPTEPATVITDKDTNVSVEGDIPEGVELNVESAEAVVENAVAAYNITLEKDGKAVQPDGKVTVKLPVPDGVDGSQCKVYYIDGDSKTDMNAVFVDGYLVFETDHFSVYAIVKTEKTSVLLGDVNADGKVNIKDATTIQKSAASLITLTEKQKKAADVNADGKVNVNDVTAIQRYVAGIDTGFEIGK